MQLFGTEVMDISRRRKRIPDPGIGCAKSRVSRADELESFLRLEKHGHLYLRARISFLRQRGQQRRAVGT